MSEHGRFPVDQPASLWTTLDGRRTTDLPAEIIGSDGDVATLRIDLAEDTDLTTPRAATLVWARDGQPVHVEGELRAADGGGGGDDDDDDDETFEFAAAPALGRRVHPRHPVSLTATWQVFGQSTAGRGGQAVVHDLSLAGARLEVDGVAEDDQLLVVSIAEEHDDGLNLLARVARAPQLMSPGHWDVGVEFEYVDPDLRTRLERLIRQLSG